MAVTRRFFPYLTQGWSVSLDSARTYGVRDGELTAGAPVAADLTGLTSALAEDGEFTISLVPDEEVIVRDPETHAFLVIDYSLRRG